MDTENEDIITETADDLQHYDNFEQNTNEQNISTDVIENENSEVVYNEMYEQDSHESIENVIEMENGGSFDNVQPDVIENVDFVQHDEINENETQQENDIDQEDEVVENERETEVYQQENNEETEVYQQENNEETEVYQQENNEETEVYQQENNEETEVFQQENDEQPEIFQQENDEETEVYQQENDDVENSDLQENSTEQETILQDNSVRDDNVVIGEDVYEETEVVSEEIEQNENYTEHLQEDYIQEENVTDAGEQEIMPEVEEESEVAEESGVGEREGEQEDDYGGDVVQEEEEDVVDENVAQHDNEEEGEEEDLEENVKLGHASDDDVRGSEDESNVNDEKEEEKSETVIAKMFDSDSEDEDEEKEGDLVADIFGKSDDENEEFVGFRGEEEGAAGKRGALISDSDTDEEDEPVQIVQPTSHSEEYSERRRDEDSDDGGSRMVYDFDLMLQKKKAERKNPRKRDGGTFISDADDIINAMLTKMKEAAEADRAANHSRKPALKKLKMLPTVVRHLNKQDLKEAFVDNGMIAAIADWLSLLPDKGLVHLSIRTELLKVLHDLPAVSSETLKASGVGRSVMILFKHPRETRQNRESAGRLINKWSRPLFGLNENFKSMSRGEREQRDLEQMPQSKRRRLSAGQNIEEKGDEAAVEPGQLRPGDRGFVLRARVPKPSHKDYVIRPKWKVDSQDDEDAPSFRSKRAKPKKDERLEKHLKSFADRRKNQKMQRAVGISIEGSKMPLT